MGLNEAIIMSIGDPVDRCLDGRGVIVFCFSFSLV